MDRFYASWPDGKRAKARKLHKLTAFIEFWVKRKWLAEDISADLEPPEGHSIPRTKLPSQTMKSIALSQPAINSSGNESHNLAIVKPAART
jgi:hypothetical protein